MALLVQIGGAVRVTVLAKAQGLPLKTAEAFSINVSAVFYGLFLVIFIVALPEGIFHYVQSKYHQFERWVEVE